MVASAPTTPRKVTDPDDNIPCKTPSPRSSASQAPPNPRHNEDEPPPRVNPHAPPPSHPFKGFGRKFMGKRGHGDELDDKIHKKSKEATERAKKLDLGPALGVHDTVNVRERVRKWQAAGGGVVNGDPVEMPPIMPATPSPSAPRKRGLSTVTIESDLRNTPLVPPDVIMKELREGWESASDADKQAVRRRARSVERERKMKRRRDRERDLNKSSVGGQTELEVEVTIDGATEAGSGISKSIVYDDDGIRITPMRVKRRGSGSRRKKKKERDAQTDRAAEVQTDNDVGGGVRVEPETEVEEEGGGVKVEVKAWEYDDGIRIYTNKPRTPALVRSQGSGHTNSVRKSEKSVRARKEEFEAEMRKERKAAREFEALVKKQEAEEAEEREKQQLENEERIRKEQEAFERAEASTIEGTTVIGDYESARKKWDEDDDGIRVKPLRNKGTRRKKGAGGSMEKLGTEREATIAEESILESERDREKEKEIEKEKQRQLDLEVERLERERQRERDLEKQESERHRLRQQEKLDKERQRVRELEKLEQVRSRQREIDNLEKDKELEKERQEKEHQRQIELEKLEKEKKRQRELEKALEKEKEKREKERIRLREKEREMEQERKRERQRMKEREKELEREREREREKIKEKERQLEKERQRDREKEREREREIERERGLLRAKEKEIEREKEREIRRVRDMENQREMERQRERDMEKEMQRRRNEKRRKREVLKQKQSDAETESEEDTESESESIPIKNQKIPARPLTPEDPLLEFFRKAAKRGNSPRLHEQMPQRDSTPPLEPVKRWESRKKKESKSAPSTPIPKTPSPQPFEEKPSPSPSPTPTNEEPPPLVPNRPKRVKAKRKNAVSPPPVEKAPKRSTSASSSSMSSQDELAVKEKAPSARSTPQPAEEPTSKDAEPTSRPLTADSGMSSSLQSFKEAAIPVSPPPVMPLKLSPKKKKSDNGSFMPGISSATTSFFKAVSKVVKEEFQSVSARVDESSSDGESLDDVLDRRAETPTRKMPHSIREESESSEEDSKDSSEDEQVKEVKKETHTKEVHVATEEKPMAKNPSQRSSIILEDIPQLPLPRRSLRNSPSPPRPKGKHHRSRTEGSITPSPSIADDTGSISGSEHARTISLSSVSTVKPLNITPRLTPALKFDPISPPGQKSSAEKQPTPSKNDAEEEEAREVFYTPSILSKGASLKRKYTKHADLISILSAPKPSKSVRSAARARSHRTKANRKVSTLTITDLMDEIASEEIRYMRELRTLVEDVVPVLFSTVLERADDIVRRTSMNGGNNNNYSLRTGFGANPTRPIVDMGISLERLKTMHARMPRKPEELLIWATDAKKVYEEYLSVWRMGFQDVVVTLASNLDEDDDDEATQKQKCEAARKDLELLYSFGVATPTPINYEGDPSTWAMPPPPPPEPEDEKVDVAFLLKRPLVRLKILAKLFKRINILSPSPLALSLSSSFHTLVTMARRKIAEEKARIEDEAAASIDVSRASDIHTLFARLDISLDPSKRVRARDSFWMKLYHSSGRVLQRNVELILRDPAAKGRPHGGEILICEFGAGVEKWLLFAPVPLAAISSRTGDAAGEIVVMIRGVDQVSQEEWKQILVLQSATAAGFEWVQMFGLMPIPPEGPFGDEVHKPTVLDTVIEESTIASSSRMQTPALGSLKPKPAIDVFSFMESEHDEDHDLQKLEPQPLFATPVPTPKPALSPQLVPQPTPSPQPVPSPQLENPRSENAFGIPGAAEFRPAAETVQYSIPPDFAVMPIIPGGYRFEGGHFEVCNVSADGTSKGPDDGPVMLASPLRHSPSLHTLSDSAGYPPSEPARSVSGSSIQRSRKASKPLNLRRQSIISRDDESRSPSPPLSPRQLDTPRTLSRARSIHLDDDDERPKPLSITKSPFGDIPVLTPNRPETPEAATPTKQDTPQPDAPPPVPPHRTPTKARSKSRTPVLAPASDSPAARSGMPRRRTSSPLKHEYDPSSPSGSDNTEGEEEEDEEDGEGEGEEEEEEEEIGDRSLDQVSHDEDSSGSSSSSSSSSSSEDDESDDAVSICSEEEDGDYPPPMLSIPRRVSKKPSGIVALPKQRPSSVSLASIPTSVTTTTTTATQAPVPTLRFRSFVFSWATNQWEKLYPNECKILITPGHIEGLPSTSPPGTPSSQGSAKERLIAEKAGSSRYTELNLAQKPSDTSLESCIPIFGIDLTPLTPVRRGTAVDISIRTPKNSKFAGTSLMLRCRAPNECESLYNAINLNRIYPANFQAPSTLLSSLAVSELGVSESSSTDNANVKRGWGSWGRSKTYRAGVTSAPGSVISSSAGQSESSLSSAFGRFRQKNGMIKNSPLSSVASTSSGSTNGDGSRGGTPTGVPDSNLIFKVRLYRRENSSKWRDLGNSRVSILKPPKTHKHPTATGLEKRIVATNKAGNLVLLDAVLGESSFERVARTGIAVSVLVGEGEENGTGVPGGVGGLGSKSTVYMLQMKGEAEAAHIFSIVGKLRY